MQACCSLIDDPLIPEKTSEGFYVFLTLIMQLVLTCIKHSLCESLWYGHLLKPRVVVYYQMQTLR